MSAEPRFDIPSTSPGRVIDDATVWHGKDFPDDRSWVHALTTAMSEEIVSLARHARSRGLDPRQMRAEDFPIDRCREELTAIHREVECGPGFAMLSGFPIEGLDREELELAYCGLGAHFGHIMVQNREGEHILEVTDKGKGYSQQSRGYHSTAHLDFHNDGTSIVTLLCLETAAEGGQSMLVSGPAVYNAVVSEAPEHLAALHRGFHHHRRDQKNPDDAPVTPYRTPVFGFYDELFHMAFAGPSIRYCENEGVVITEEENAALAFLEAVIERPRMRVTMELRKGDIQLVNNFLVLHARTAYRDSGAQRRKLLRLWLDDRSSRRLGPGKMDWYMPEHSRFTRTGGIACLEHA